MTCLSQHDQAELEKSFRTSTYVWDDFRRDALAALRNRFHQSVAEGNKSIKIGAGPSRLAADVVVCIEYRRYTFTGIIRGRDCVLYNAR